MGSSAAPAINLVAHVERREAALACSTPRGLDSGTVIEVGNGRFGWRMDGRLSAMQVGKPDARPVEAGEVENVVMALFATVIMALVGSIGLNCPASVNTEEVWSSPGQKWLVIGEDHGTNEEPEAFFDIVCQASAKRVVTVAVEQAASEQGAINSFIESDGSEAARIAFLKSPIWYGSFRDGRSSHAYFLLFERLRLLQKSGRITSVIAFQPAGQASPADYEKEMAVELVKRSPPNSLVIALVGGVHAMRTRVSFGGAGYLPMAGHLPESQTKSVALKGAGGKQWACQSPTECGPIDVFQDEGQFADGLTLTPNDDAPYSAVLGLGRSTSASEPQVPNS